MREFDFSLPKSIDEVITALDDRDSCVVAGGTDVIPKMKRNGALLPARVWVDISHIHGLRFIRQEANRIHIGALTTHSEIIESSVLKEFSPSLVEAASTIGCVQTRNRGTLGGNLANASPAADSVPPLIVMDAQVHLLSGNGTRCLPVEEFFLGPGKTKLAAGEIIHSVSFDLLEDYWGTVFLKNGKRNGMAIAVASAAAAVILNSKGLITRARVAVGSVAPRPIRSLAVETAVVGQAGHSDVFRLAAREVVKDIAPIDDVRASAEYREHAVVVLVQRALEQAYKQAMRRIV
jgi:CO/xanthine dehydrogenase FAD-binding subunit